MLKDISFVVLTQISRELLSLSQQMIGVLEYKDQGEMPV